LFQTCRASGFTLPHWRVTKGDIMTLIASGINKLLTFKKQSALGTIATVGSAQNLRRTSSSLDFKKATYQSKELRPSQQISDMRHGVRSVDGTISGEMSCGTYQAFTESVCRQLVLSAVTSGALTDVTAATTGGATGTFTTAGANWLTAGFKVGMVFRWTGWATTGATNNATNMLITALTATVMTVIRLDGSAVGAKASGDSVTALEKGKHTFIPATGQTRDYYTIEHNFADIVQSEVFVDCVPTQMDVKLPASGMATIDFMFKGLSMNRGTTGYFTSPSAVSNGSVLAAANGALYLQGVAVGLITGMNFSVKGGHTTIGGVVGANSEPDIFPGTVTVDGQVTVLFTDATIRDYFVDEVEVSLYAVFTTNNSATSDFQAFTFPRVKVGGASKDDGEKGLVMTMPFVALENTSGGAGTNSHATTFVVQDSLFA
jgi:hypothetical protein